MPKECTGIEMQIMRLLKQVKTELMSCVVLRVCSVYISPVPPTQLYEVEQLGMKKMEINLSFIVVLCCLYFNLCNFDSVLILSHRSVVQCLC